MVSSTHISEDCVDIIRLYIFVVGPKLILAANLVFFFDSPRTGASRSHQVLLLGLAGSGFWKNEAKYFPYKSKLNGPGTRLSSMSCLYR